jgi:L-alanine-DL-glutamate epimerase-like enolase superfamily enzyme
MALRGMKPRRLVLGALTVVTLAAATAVTIVLWATAGPATGVRVYQAPHSGTKGDQARAYALGLLAKLELPR